MAGPVVFTALVVAMLRCAGGVALGRIPGGSGAAEAFANALVPYPGPGGWALWPAFGEA